MASKLKYGIYVDYPVVFNDYEAWVTDTDKWEEVILVLAWTELMTKAEFDQRFPDLPTLPKAAFQRRFKYAIWEFCPVVFNDYEAWTIWNCGKDEHGWRPENLADVMHKAGLMTKAEFDQIFPHLPPLPQLELISDKTPEQQAAFEARIQEKKNLYGNVARNLSPSWRTIFLPGGSTLNDKKKRSLDF